MLPLSQVVQYCHSGVRRVIEPALAVLLGLLLVVGAMESRLRRESQPSRDDGGAVSANLCPRAAEFAGVKAHCHNRVPAAPGGFVDQSLDRLLTTLSQHCCHSLQLSTE